MAENTASSGLFAVFMLSIYSLFLIPYTIYRFCSAGEDVTTQPVVKSKKAPPFSERLKGVCTKQNLVLLGLWVLWGAMLYYSQHSISDMKPFDPFEILGVSHDASEREIKKAYFKLSLQYHPDKNPDPKAHEYFASYIAKAYAALTDEVSKANYIKYGHPDGHQGMNLGVALPEWMFAKDSKAAPLMLLVLVGGGILLPMALMSWYMLSSSKYTGPNQIMNDTFPIFFNSKYAIKESQSLVRIHDTLLWAMEFLTLYTPSEHNLPMDDLRKVVTSFYPEMMSRSNKAFWQRKASQIKVHMLMLAHLERLGDEVHPLLHADLKYFRTKAPQLLEEMVKIAAAPRYANNPVGWMTPALASVEMMQCIAQGIPVSVRKGSGKASDTMPAMMALPGMDSDVVKKLRKRKITSVADLQALSESERSSELFLCGLDDVSIEAINLHLSALPRLNLAVKVEADEDDSDIQQGDIAHCKVRVLLSRPSHRSEGFQLRGSAVRAYTPNNPVERDESWYFFLVEPNNNAVWTWTKVNLMEAEKEGLAHPEVFKEAAAAAAAAGGGANNNNNNNNNSSSSNNSSTKAVTAAAAAADASSAITTTTTTSSSSSKSKGSKTSSEPAGQEVDLAFPAWQKEGTYNLQLIVMSDCWVGADESMPVKVRINAQSAARMALANGTGGKSAKVDDSDSDDYSGSGGSDEEDSDEDDEDDYDSEETGEEESEDSS